MIKFKKPEFLKRKINRYEVADAINSGSKGKNQKFKEPDTMDFASSTQFLFQIIMGHKGTKPAIKNPEKPTTPISESINYFGEKVSSGEAIRPPITHTDRESASAQEIMNIADSITNDTSRQQQNLSLTNPNDQIPIALKFLGSIIRQEEKITQSPKIVMNTPDAQVAKGILAIASYIAEFNSKDVTTDKTIEHINSLQFPDINYAHGDLAVLGASLAYSVNRPSSNKSLSTSTTFEKKLKANLKKWDTPTARIAEELTKVDLRRQILSIAKQSEKLRKYNSGQGIAAEAVANAPNINPFAKDNLPKIPDISNDEILVRARQIHKMQRVN